MSNEIYLDSKWNLKLENFVTQKGATVGVKIGIIGIGQGGSKIADMFAAIKNPSTGAQVYPVLCFNTFEGDLADLKNVDRHNRIQFKGKEFENGAGMDPEKGRRALEANGEDVFTAVERTFKDVDAIGITASYGGGTGTGAANLMADVISQYFGKPVFMIVSLPKPHIDENINAYNALKETTPKLEIVEDDDGAYRILQNLTILDNKKIIEDHIEEISKGEVDPALPWDVFSNYKVASILHEWNVTTTLKSDKSLDPEDFKNKLFFSGGILTFAKKKINLNPNDTEIKSEEALINEIVTTYKGKNVLANGFNYADDAIAFGLHVVMPKNNDLLNINTMEKISGRIQEELPGVPVYYGKSTMDSKHAVVYTMISLRGLPERAKNLRAESEELLRLKKERESKQRGGLSLGEEGLGGNLGQQRVGMIKQKSPINGNPFLSSRESAAANVERQSPQKFNPFKQNRE